MAAGPRVLYIDDDDGLRRLTERALTRRGYRVALAPGGAEGLALAAGERFDLVAVDHYMPGMDGLETLGHLRALPDAPDIVYVTGSEEGRIAIAALKAGAADYVVKTVGEDFFDLLAAAFDQVLARGALERDKRAAEEGLRASNARLEALLKEVNHRVANSLQLVTAMVSLQANVLDDTAARAALEDTQRRISAIAQVHRRLYTSDDVESVDMREYLDALVSELRATWSTEAAPRALTLFAEPIRLPTDRAVSLGVIVTELVSNACKYAYPGTTGEVRVALVREGGGGGGEGSEGGAAATGGAFALTVEDDGVGISPDAAPRGTGLGTRLIRAMAHSLQATLDYAPRATGTCAVLRGALG